MQKLKQNKGQLLVLQYRKENGLIDTRSGVITATTKKHILFSINNLEPEITIEIQDVVKIIKDKETLKTFKDTTTNLNK